MEGYKCKSVGIVGAGIQGVCVGLQLIKKGVSVSIFDRNEPGKMTSYGNAGHFSPYAVLQLNRPDINALLSASSPPPNTNALALLIKFVIPDHTPSIRLRLLRCNMSNSTFTSS